MSDEPSHAAKMFECLADLSMGRPPRHGRIWGLDIYLGHGPLPESKNKFMIANGCELLWCYDRQQWSRVAEILDWWCWYRTQPFTEGEDLTCEEVYRGGMAYPNHVAAGVAWARQAHLPLVAAAELAASHVAWLAAGVGVAPRMKVRDHQQAARRGVCLIGDGVPKYAMNGVAQPGIRGCNRNPNGTFSFTDRSGLSVMVYQALGRTVAGWRKVRANHLRQFEIFEGIMRRFPGAPPWGFTAQTLPILDRYFDDVTSFENAERLATLLLAPSLPFDFDRFRSAAVAGRMHRDRPSSTDDWIVDVLHETGAAALGTCDDGKRPRGEKQHTEEETVAYACIVDGEAQPRVRVSKPVGPKVYSIQSRPGRPVVAVRAGAPAVLPSTPLHDEPPAPVRKPSRRWYEVS